MKRSRTPGRPACGSACATPRWTRPTAAARSSTASPARSAPGWPWPASATGNGEPHSLWPSTTAALRDRVGVASASQAWRAGSWRWRLAGTGAPYGRGGGPLAPWTGAVPRRSERDQGNPERRVAAGGWRGRGRVGGRVRACGGYPPWHRLRREPEAGEAGWRGGCPGAAESWGGGSRLATTAGSAGRPAPGHPPRHRPPAGDLRYRPLRFSLVTFTPTGDRARPGRERPAAPPIRALCRPGRARHRGPGKPLPDQAA